MIVIDINSPEFKKRTINELKQSRAHLHKLLVESDSVSEREPGAAEVNRGLHEELEAVQAEIKRKENAMDQEAAAARGANGRSVGYNARNEAAILPLKPEERFYDYMKRNDMIRDDGYEDLTMGALLRSMVTGPRNEIERRALGEGSDSAGGVTVPTAVLARFFDLLRANLVVVQLGASSIPTDTEKTVVAKLASDPVCDWVSENATITPVDNTFDSVLLQARTARCIVKASRELISDSVNVEEMLQRSFVGALAAKVDLACLTGSGTPPSPKGIANTDNVNSVDLQGTDFDSYDKFIDAVVKCWQSNSQTVNGIVLSPANLGIVSKLKEATTNAPLAMPPVLQGIPFKQTTNCPNDIGFVGDWSQLIMSFRTTLRVEVLRELYAESFAFGYLAFLRFDCALAHPEAFCTLDNVSLS